MTMTGRSRVGLAGAGWVSPHHLEAWSRIPERAAVVAIADPDLDAARARAAAFNIGATYPSVDAMLRAERLDALDIATPRETHAPICRLAARHGLAILCQKPLAPTLEEAETLLADLGPEVRLMVHENWRFQPWFREISRLIDEGFCGRIFEAVFFMRSGDGRGGALAYSEQPYFRTMERLLVYEMLVHLLDTLRFLIAEIESVCCQIFRVNSSIKGEDGAVIAAEAVARRAQPLQRPAHAVEAGVVAVCDAVRPGADVVGARKRREEIAPRDARVGDLRRGGRRLPRGGRHDRDHDPPAEPRQHARMVCRGGWRVRR